LDDAEAAAPEAETVCAPVVVVSSSAFPFFLLAFFFALGLGAAAVKAAATGAGGGGEGAGPASTERVSSVIAVTPISLTQRHGVSCSGR
jgi:hypothetical protein